MQNNAVKYLIALATAGAGIRVRFHGQQAYTNGKMINLPATETPESQLMSPGYAWHESFHILYTDFDLYKRRESEVRGNAMLPKLINAIEDGRIERNGRITYPGVVYTINKLIEHVKSKGESLFNAPTSKTDPANALLGYVLNWTRWNINDYSSITELDKWRRALVGYIGEEVVQKIDAVLERSRTVSSTEEVFHLSKEILDLIQNLSQQNPDEKPQQGEGKESGDGEQDQAGDAGNSQSDDDGDSEGSSKPGDDESDEDVGSDSSGDGDQGESEPSEGSSEGSSKPGDDESDEDVGSDSSGDGDQGESESSDGSSDGSSGAGEDETNQTEQPGKQQEQAKAILDADSEDLEGTDLGDLAAEAMNEAAQQAASKGAGGGCGGALSLEPAGQSPGEYAEIAAPAAALAARLRNTLQDVARKKQAVAHKTGRKLHRRKLVRVSLDDNRIWRSAGRVIDTTAHVHLILDTSGSMQEHMDDLRKYALGTARAVESVAGLDLSVVALPCYCGFPIIKHKDEKVAAVASRFRDLYATGGTPMTETLEASKHFALRSPKPLKLVVIFTDGAPNDASSLETLVNEIASQGVKTCGVILGEGYNQLEDMVPCAKIASLNELPIVVSNLITRSVKESKHAR